MSIRVICHNGHTLKVNDRLAGKLGLCPVCKVQVQVPSMGPAAISEDAIMGMLAPQGDDARRGLAGKNSRLADDSGSPDPEPRDI